MIWLHVPGFPRPAKATRYGDGQVLTDFLGNWLVIDAFTGIGKQYLIKFLKLVKAKDPILLLSHPHIDHGDGLFDIINDSYFTPRVLLCYDPESLRPGLRNNAGSKEVKDDIAYLNKLIKLAKSKGIPVKYIKNGDTLKYGEILFKVYRRQPTRVEDDDKYGWEYVNNGSLACYFPDLDYWTSGDGPDMPFDLIKAVKAVVKFFKIVHHGNTWTQSQAEGAYKAGAHWCWYNHLEPKGVGTTDFTMYGARRCKEAGMAVLNTIGDINVLFHGGRAYIYHAGEMYRYSCPYTGKSTLKAPGVSVVRKVLRGSYGSGDTRITNVIAAGFGPKSTQSKVDTVVNTAKEIIAGSAAGKAYGKNQTRIKRIDTAFGAGYGQLVQDYINVLLGVRKEV